MTSFLQEFIYYKVELQLDLKPQIKKDGGFANRKWVYISGRSANLRSCICDLQSLFADRPPLLSSMHSLNMELVTSQISKVYLGFMCIIFD